MGFAYWFHKYVLIICNIDFEGYDGCYMDKTLEELKVINVSANNNIARLIEKK
tara:strand:- start:681 stop:839 length:159 start_codon:yes stop_codon:yes gene_type:complete